MRITSSFGTFAIVSTTALLLGTLWASMLLTGAKTSHAQTGGVASVTIRISNEVDCESDPETHVYFDITPPEGAEVSVLDVDVTRIFSSTGTSEDEGVDGYFGNGTYQARITPMPGFTLSGLSTRSFTVAKTCDILPLPTPVVATTTTVTTTSTVTTPITETVETTPPPVAPPTTIVAPTTTTTMASTETALALPPTRTCTTEEECLALCAEPESGCASELTENILRRTGSTTGVTTDPALIEEFIAVRSGIRAHVDTDEDGITDFDEVNIYGTDPAHADTDQDGTTDGAEILSLSNPLVVASSSDAQMEFEDARIALVATTSALRVTAITATSTDGVASTTIITISGVAPQNIFVTLYIYSQPIVVTAKTDQFGAWSYTLDRELADGSHEIVTTLTDSGGRIVAKSDPLPFVKVANAISIGSPNLLPSAEPASFFSSNSLLILSGMFFITLIAGVFIVGLNTRRHTEEAGAITSDK